MSQFLLVAGPKPAVAPDAGVALHDLTEAQPFVRRVAEALLTAPERARCWYPEPADGSVPTDDLFTEAQGALHAGRPLAATRLGQLLNRALPVCTRAVAWYASDWVDLERATSTDGFCVALAAQLLADSGEVYLDLSGPATSTPRGPADRPQSQ